MLESACKYSLNIVHCALISKENNRLIPFSNFEHENQLRMVKGLYQIK